MSKIAHYLQEHLLGEVLDTPEIRRQLAYDGSVLKMVPAMAVYPRDENDIRKTMRFCWQLAERGKILPITARGGGSDTSGAAIGSGIILMPGAHMNRILALEPRKHAVTVEPGMTYDKLEQTLYTHGLFFPPYPANANYATIGGGLANNASGQKSTKYGGTSRYVQSLRVVLVNGEVIETGPLSKRELSHKMGLSTMEGEIYRQLDALLEENQQFIKQFPGGWPKGAGYNLADVKKDGHFDLTPLFLGSQGTLGIVSEATLKVEPHNPSTTLCLISLDRLEDFETLLPKITALKPSMFDILSRGAVETVLKLNPKQLTDALDVADADLHLFIEFDEPKSSDRNNHAKKLVKLVEHVGGYMSVTDDFDKQQRIWKLRESISTLLLVPSPRGHAVPVAEDVSVPPEKLPEFIKKALELFAHAAMPASFWGHAGSGILSFYPELDLTQVGDRQRFFKLSDSLYATTRSLGGQLSASGEGRIRAPQVRRLYGEDFYKLTCQVKKIFDPHGFLNPGVKDTSSEEILSMLRTDYSLAHRHEHIPKS